MPRILKIGNAVYASLVKTKPTRGPVFIGSSTDYIASLGGIEHSCFDFRKIFFALAFPAEKYDNAPDTVFVRMVDHYPLFTDSIPGGIFTDHLAVQLVPQAELADDRNAVVRLPSCVIYTGRIDNGINSAKATDCEFIEIFCDYYDISRIRLP
jgi:hypothetical protein